METVLWDLFIRLCKKMECYTRKNTFNAALCLTKKNEQKMNGIFSVGLHYRIVRNGCRNPQCINYEKKCIPTTSRLDDFEFISENTATVKSCRRMASVT